MSASCCGASRKTAAVVVMAVALGVLVPAVVVLGVKASREPPPAPPVEAVEVAAPAHVKPKAQVLFRPGYDLMSVALAPGVEQAGVGPGSRIDVVARYAIGNETSELTVVPAVVVMCVDCVNQGLVRDDPYPRLATFPVDQKQGALVMLAHRLNCELAVVPHRPDAPAPAWDYDATLARLKGLEKAIRDAELEVAPFPRAVP